MVKILFIFFIVYSAAFPQELNKIITDSESGEPMLIGRCTLEAFEDSGFAWWWNSEYNMYEPDSTVFAELKSLSDYDITVVMGTWCSDSKSEAPKFFKILNVLDYPVNKVDIICVDRDKYCKVDGFDKLEIELVPTFIFYHDNEEAGRIVEMPEETLEKDLAGIIN